ncbi:MAG: LptF/LptG family permease [Nitrospirae bacterium]|nr:LptF/LptG family permease [Nitrospirota bacterium]
MIKIYNRNRIFKLSLIDKATLKELFYTFVLSIASFNIILMMERILKLSMLLSGVGASVLDFIQAILLVQPQLMLLTLPMSFMTSVLFTYGRLKSDNEIVIYRATGMSFGTISRPVFIFALFCFIVATAVSFKLSPVASTAFRDKLKDVITTKSPLAIEEGVFYSFFKGVTIFVKKKAHNGRLDGIFIYDTRNKDNPWTIFAESASISVNPDLSIGFVLKNGEVFMAESNAITKISFDSYNMVVRFTPQFNMQVSELTPFELLKRAANKQGEDRLLQYVEFHRRLTLPLMPLVLSLIAPPLAMLSGKKGRLSGLSFSMAIFLIYYSFLVYCEKLVRAGKLPHYTGCWLPFTAMLLVSIYFYARECRR